jgi:hypothetical protein
MTRLSSEAAVAPPAINAAAAATATEIAIRDVMMSSLKQRRPASG